MTLAELQGSPKPTRTHTAHHPRKTKRRKIKRILGWSDQKCDRMFRQGLKTKDDELLAF